MEELERQLKELSFDGAGALHFLAGTDSKHSYAMTRVLLERGADPNSLTTEGLTPVHIAAAWGNYELLMLLLLNGGNPELRDGDGKTAFDLATEEAHWECLRLLKSWLSADGDAFRLGSPINSSTLRSKEYIPKYFVSPFGPNNSKKAEDQISEDLSLLSEVCAGERFAEFSGRSPTRRRKGLLSRFACCCGVGFDDSPLHEYKPQSPGTFTSIRGPKTTDSVHTKHIPVRGPKIINGVQIMHKNGVATNLSDKFAALEDPKRKEEDCWKSLESEAEELEEQEQSEVPAELLADCRAMSDEELRGELRRFGMDVGPMLLSTRPLYSRRLAQLLLEDIHNFQSIQKFSKELEIRLKGNLEESEIVEADDRNLVEFFERGIQGGRSWREGTQKTSFCYLLLDPSISKNLPSRASGLTYQDRLRTFLDSVFYIGKGKKSRPYQHLVEAAEEDDDEEQSSAKVERIRDIWRRGFGVVSIHVFHNVIPAEAYTREAAMIDAIKLSNLSNVRRGDYYGLATAWTASRKRRWGAFLLHTAMSIFFLEGERQLRPEHVS